MNSGLRVSVVIPCFNADAYVLEAIASTVGQSTPPDEIIVVDDGSTDNSLEVIRGSNLPIRVLRQENGGVAAARNAGIRQSGGDVLAFLDADDVWPSHSLSVRLAEMDRSGADMVAGRVRQCRDGIGADAATTDPELIGRLAGAVLIRRPAFERVGYFDDRLRSAETVDWMARARDAGLSEAHCDEVVLYRRIHGSNMMHMGAQGDRDRIAVLRNALARRRASAP